MNNKECALRLWTPELTPMQLRLLPYIAAGWTNKQMAAHLHVTTGTIRTHLARMFTALALDNRQQVSAWAAAVGLTDVEQTTRLLLQHAPHLEGMRL